MTFGAPTLVTAVDSAGVNGDLGLTGQRNGTSSLNAFRSNKFPHLAVNP